MGLLRILWFTVSEVQELRMFDVMYVDDAVKKFTGEVGNSSAKDRRLLFGRASASPTSVPIVTIACSTSKDNHQKDIPRRQFRTFSRMLGGSFFKPSTLLMQLC